MDFLAYVRFTFTAVVLCLVAFVLCAVAMLGCQSTSLPEVEYPDTVKFCEVPNNGVSLALRHELGIDVQFPCEDGTHVILRKLDRPQSLENEQPPMPQMQPRLQSDGSSKDTEI